jgi:ankyrin repeat protein
MLLERGCTISGKGAYGYTPLHQVAYTEHDRLCDFILKNRGNLDALSRNGSTPLLIACREGHAGIVETMLRYGADPNDGGDKGLTPIMIAASEGHADILRLLLEFGAEGREVSFELRTPLHEAVEGGHVHACKVLLEMASADPAAPDADGTSALAIAASAARPDLLSLLQNPPAPVVLVKRHPDLFPLPPVVSAHSHSPQQTSVKLPPPAIPLDLPPPSALSVAAS